MVARLAAGFRKGARVSIGGTGRTVVALTVAAQALAFPAAAALAATPAATATLVVHIHNIRNGAGRVHVDLCGEAEFLHDGCARKAEVPARAGAVTMTFAGVPPGRYAIQLTHDENGDGKVNRGLFGIPREGVGFSNDAPIRFGPPRFADAALTLAPGTRTVEVRMRYFLGASGPAAPRNARH